MNSLKNPLTLLSSWRKEEATLSGMQPLACLSTVGLDGFPNARIVTVKDIIDDTVIITGPLNSRKGAEINNNNKVALTFCCHETNRQIRIQGIAEQISKLLADEYFKERSASAKAVSIVCHQGQTLTDESIVKQQIAQELAKKMTNSTSLTRPNTWGGYSIQIKRIEFMQYQDTSFHKRDLYEQVDGHWDHQKLQP